MQAYLKKHGPGHSDHVIKIIWTRVGPLFSLEFEIKKRTQHPWQTDELFSSDWRKNWGVWNKDILECFLQLRNTPDDLKAPYLEIQVSPLNQPFALIITEPRKTFFAPRTLVFETQVNLTEKLWSGKMQVELPPDLKGELLFGGFYSCLASDPREYYALEPNPEVQPDFHRPELFLNLDQP